MKVYTFEVEPYTTADEFIEWAGTREWKFARTMAQIPHFYTVAYRTPTFREAVEQSGPHSRQKLTQYMRALATIRAYYSYTERWGTNEWAYFTCGDYKYWAGKADSYWAKDHHHLNRTYADERLVALVREAEDPQARARMSVGELRELL